MVRSRKTATLSKREGPKKRIGVSNKGSHSRWWLPRNRIDAFDMRNSVGGMKQIELEEMKSLAPPLCQCCGALMRLIGSEAHPIEANRPS